MKDPVSMYVYIWIMQRCKWLRSETFTSRGISLQNFEAPAVDVLRHQNLFRRSLSHCRKTAGRSGQKDQPDIISQYWLWLNDLIINYSNIPLVTAFLFGIWPNQNTPHGDGGAGSISPSSPAPRPLAERKIENKVTEEGSWYVAYYSSKKICLNGVTVYSLKYLLFPPKDERDFSFRNHVVSPEAAPEMETISRSISVLDLLASAI